MLLLLPAFAFRDQLPTWLEELTGETDPRQQVEGLIHLVRQRRVETADLSPSAYAGVYPFGANTFFEQEVEEWKLRRSMEMLRAAGIRWFRQQFPWDRIEPEARGRFSGPSGSTWQPFDRIMSLAEEYGLEPVVRLDLAPRWSHPDAPFRRGPPADLNDYGDFVAAVVQRYKGRVRYYQVWNEPNLFFEWGSAPNAAHYVRLLRVAYQRAKAADPQVVILSAALSPTLGTPDGLNQSDLTYLQEMYDAGARDYFDILSAQGYGLWTGPGDRRADPSQVNFSRVQLLREIMVRNGDAGKAIWLSEMGWDAVPLDFPGEALHGRVTEEQQARYTLAAFRRIQEEWPWVGVVFYWHFRKVSDEARSQEDFYFRLVDPDFTPRPVYYAVQQAASQPPGLGRGWHRPDHWALAFDGVWEGRGGHGPAGPQAPLRISRQIGSRVAFTFNGTGLTLVVGKRPMGGRLAVEVDGASLPVNRIATGSSPGAVVDTRAPGERSGIQTPVAAGLAKGPHRVVLTALDDAPVTLEGIIVVGEEATAQEGLVAAGLLAGGAVALLAASLAKAAASP
ncbi:MAG: hypothetical protein HYY02_05685 [Chloroflexi bacterium]|nr:hypothetical protein [Chloroflexota bacterium]